MGTLSDIAHYWGNDLQPSVTLDLATCTGDLRTQQRILRRLMTNPAPNPDYIWHPTYGAGLRRFIGSTASPAEIQAVVQGQMQREDSVAPTPRPTCAVQVITGGLSLTLNYTDAATGQPATLSFSVTD